VDWFAAVDELPDTESQGGAAARRMADSRAAAIAESWV
jgi:hypothetical protein